MVTHPQKLIERHQDHMWSSLHAELTVSDHFQYTSMP